MGLFFIDALIENDVDLASECSQSPLRSVIVMLDILVAPTSDTGSYYVP
jgi:hypothetical protein